MDFIYQESFEVKGNELQQKITELLKERPNLNVCRQRYDREINLESTYTVKIFRNNVFDVDILIFKENKKEEE